MTDYAERLAQMQEAFDETEAKTGGARIPDDDYEGQIERFDFWEKDGGGPLKLITEISVVGGEYDGRSAPSVWHELEDPDRIAWTKGYLEMLGLGGVPLVELPKALEPLCGNARVAFRVTTTERDGNKYTNVYINELLGTGGSSDFAPPASSSQAADEDDIPF